MTAFLNRNYQFNLALILISITFGACSKSNSTSISVNSDNLQIQFAIKEIQNELHKLNTTTKTIQNKNADINFIVQPDNTEIKAEGFEISKSANNKIEILASDAAGAMYGGLELAEQIKLYGMDSIKPTLQNPYMEMRGAKFNIPLDVRTPSYTDPCDAAQNNIAEMWNFDFWKEYIDHMARYRYNYISLWNLHPFPSMVRVPGYEDVALDDVQRSTVKWKEFYNGNGVGFDAPEIINNVEVLKKMTIDEKMEFWKKVMAYGKSRNVDFYIITWNIFVNGTNGKYGITDKIDNPVTRDYFKKSVKQMFIEYPNLKGIGLTTGENMHGAGFEDKEQWAFDTYGQGTLDAAKEMPDRKMVFVHRQHQTGAQDIARTFKPLIDAPNVEFIFSFKYAKAHVFSCTKQPYHEKFEKDIGDMKTIWTLRNDDSYMYRWGSPDFTREFIKNIPHTISKGLYYGSDQWVWGREFTTKNIEGQHPLEVVKHWYHWMMWGRLSYNPQLKDTRFEEILQARFPETDAAILFEAWQQASMVYPVTTGFHWGPLDFQWYIEGCKSRPGYAQNKTGFHDVNRFINLPPHVYTGYQSIPDYVEDLKSGVTSDKKTPLEVAQILHNHANKAMALAAQIENNKNSLELKRTIHDIQTMAAMGKYYAYKIEGATHYAVYQSTGKASEQQKAIDALTLALDKWKKFAALNNAQNIDQIWTNRVGYVNWKKITQWVKQDIDIVKEKH